MNDEWEPISQQTGKGVNLSDETLALEASSGRSKRIEAFFFGSVLLERGQRPQIYDPGSLKSGKSPPSRRPETVFFSFVGRRGFFQCQVRL